MRPSSGYERLRGCRSDRHHSGGSPRRWSWPAPDLDPLGLRGSGALLITLRPADVPGLLAALEEEGIDGWEIGLMTAPEEGLQMIGRQGEVPLPKFNRDELARYLSQNG